MKTKTKTKIVSCVGCSKFCANQDQKKLQMMLDDLKSEGYDEIIFCCEIFKKFVESACLKSPIKVGVKNDDGVIKYFNE